MILKRLLFISLFALVIISCNKKGFLEEKPYSFLSSDALYSSDAGARAALTGCWSSISTLQGYGANYSLVLDLTSGGWFNQAAAYKEMNALTYTASSTYLDAVSPYKAFYGGIAVANDIIAKLPDGNVSAGLKDNLLGQAYLIRGMIYFNLVRMYGGVPLRLLPTTKEDVSLPRASKNDVYAQIITDLEKAAQLLPLKAGQEVGRPAKYAAVALLGKVYIAMAGGDNSSPYWQKAKDALLEVVNSNQYSLVPKFQDLWDINKQNSQESIIEIQFSRDGAENSMSNFYTPTGTVATPLVTNGPFGRHRPNKESYTWHTIQYPGDPRIDATYFHDQLTRLDGTIVKIWPQNKAGQGFPYMKKYVDPGFVSRKTSCNFIYLRYADVLLSLAEAENEINGPDNAYQYVNEVLNRARTSISPASVEPQDYSGMTQEEFRTRIMLERRYELMGEVHLWYDTRRRGQDYLFNFFTQHNNFSLNGGLNLSFDYKYNLDAKYLLLPIPSSEINNNTAMTPSDQNPGY
ncbi:MAG: RagB/SusD family nutrient uptake outer membrane protein [Chitinophagaceae bacterium]|nr:RagB/SusD family nutrient uptake outer membrane protein [Chitinophagaceae bacterium]